MHQITLTDFVDIVSASGTPKATKVRDVATRGDYDPAHDFYKKIRETIVAAHCHGHGKPLIDQALEGLTDPKKITAYPVVASGYMKWWGRKDTEWFDAPSKHYARHDVRLSVNPELGLIVNGTPYLIKLYFKKDPLSKSKVDLITHLLAIATQPFCPDPDSTVVGVLDVRRSKLITPTVPIDGLSAMIDAELSYINALWDALYAA